MRRDKLRHYEEYVSERDHHAPDGWGLKPGLFHVHGSYWTSALTYQGERPVTWILSRRSRQDIARSCLLTAFRPQELSEAKYFHLISAFYEATTRILSHFGVHEVHDFWFEDTLRDPRGTAQRLAEVSNLHPTHEAIESAARSIDPTLSQIE